MKIVEKLGEGAYGSVYRAEYNNQVYAVKRNSVDKNVDFYANLRELDLLTTLKGHPFIIPLAGISFTSPFKAPLSPLRRDLRDDPLFFILESAESDLHDLIYKHGMTVTQHKAITVQLLLALEFIHAKGIIHRDIKPSNILWSGESIKICDFGLSKHFTPQGSQTPRVITSWYRSPEVFIGAYSFKADIWSAGCLLAECLAERPLFRGGEDEVKEQIKRFTGTDLRSNLSALLGSRGDYPDYDKLIYLLSAMLHPNPEKRPTAKECLDMDFCRGSAPLLEKVRRSHPPTAGRELVFNVYPCPERKVAAEVANDMYNHREELAWYSPRILFTSIMLFDRYLNYLHHKYPNGLKGKGEYHSPRGSILRYMVCLYMSVKYHSTVYIPERFTEFAGKKWKDILKPSGELMKNMGEFEKFMIQQVCQYRIYSPTPYEMSDMLLSPDQVRLLLYFYGVIGGDKPFPTTSGKIFSSWSLWVKKK